MKKPNKYTYYVQILLVDIKEEDWGSISTIARDHWFADSCVKLPLGAKQTVSIHISGLNIKQVELITEDLLPFAQDYEVLVSTLPQRK